MIKTLVVVVSWEVSWIYNMIDAENNDIVVPTNHYLKEKSLYVDKNHFDNLEEKTGWLSARRLQWLGSNNL